MALSQQEQAQVVAKAYELEKKQKAELDKLKNIQSQVFKNPPLAPTKQTAPSVKYPEPKPNFKFDWLCFLLTFLIIPPVLGLPAALVFRFGHIFIAGFIAIFVFLLYIVGPIVAVILAKSHKLNETVCGYICVSWVGYIVYYFIMYADHKAEMRNSNEYKQQCANLDEARRKQQEILDNKYNEELNVYNNETMPQYEQEKSDWNDNHNKELDGQTETYNAVVEELAALYSSTRIIPQQYHDITSLEYFNSVMSTSEYDIMATIDSYEKKLARDLDMQRLIEQQEQNQLLYEQNSQLEKQNDLQERSNRIADRARKDQRNAAVVNAVQNHNRNKYLKNR